MLLQWLPGQQIGACVPTFQYFCSVACHSSMEFSNSVAVAIYYTINCVSCTQTCHSKKDHRTFIGHRTWALGNTPHKIWNSPLGYGKMRTSHLSKITIKTYTDEWPTPRIPNLCWHLMYAPPLHDAWKKKCKLACERIAKMPVQSKQSKWN